MPISLLPHRRHFLATTVAAGALATTSLRAASQAKVDPARFALLADTHIPTNAETMSTKVNMANNLRGVVKQLGELEESPAATLIIGDCAHLEGKVSDYKLLGELLEPLATADMPVHLCLGNHDHRPNCLAAFPAETAVERRVTILRGKHANWFLLDSLDKVNKAPGLLGDEQIAWLVAALDAHADKPALIAVHHHLTPIPPTEKKVPGLVDTPALLAATVSRPQVKAIFFGHTHVWEITKHEGIHLVNLPPVAYVFGEGQPNGWVDCHLAEAGATLKLVCHDPQHRQHGETTELAWRT